MKKLLLLVLVVGNLAFGQVSPPTPTSAGLAGSTAVGGLAANGSAPVGNPVYVCGNDGTNCRALSTTGTGALQVSTNLQSQLLATNVAAGVNQTFTSTSFVNQGMVPKNLSLCLSASAATTFSITASQDGTNYFGTTVVGGSVLPTTITNAASSLQYAPAAAGSTCFQIVPQPFVKVQTSAAVTVTVHALGAY